MPRPEPRPTRERAPDHAADAALGDGAVWIQDHLDALYRYARRRLSAPDAEDVAQQAFEALFRAHAAGRTPEDAGAYLFGVARRRVADLLRTRAQRPVVSLPEGWEGIATAILPDRACESAELQDLVRVALGFLRAADRELLRGRYRRGESLEEMSAALGITPKAAELRLRRARQAFLTHFERIGRDWADADRDPHATEAAGGAS